MVCGLLYGMWDVVGHVGCCMVNGMLNVIWAARYKACSICWLFNVIWIVVWYVGC